MLSGQPLKTAMRCGFSMAQIGEFAFIFASLGLSLHVLSDVVYPVVVTVSVVTTFLTPYMIRFAVPAYEILENYFDDLMALRYAKIAKNMSRSSEEVQKAIAQFSKFSPHPGRQISNAPLQIKNADMYVVEKKGHFEVECTKASVRFTKRLHVNKLYADMLNDKGLDKETREYISNSKRKAEEFISAVNGRFSTMEQVMRAIVKRQEAFFRGGPAFLKPMILQDIADEVGRDLSTISRVTNGKYVDTPYGIFELKQFFTSGVKQGSASSAEVIGSAQILSAIKKLVDEENKKKPLSDQAIADELEKQGIKVARRTVAKYREEELKILPARLRKTV
jgi:RNA polymerase sigma-54 factor